MLSRALCHGQLSYVVGSHLDGLFSSLLNCNGRDSVTAPQTNGTYRGLSPAYSSGSWFLSSLQQKTKDCDAL